MSNVEQPAYKIFYSEGNIEIRDYPPMILAEVEVSGTRKEAIQEGFKMIADYIFGNNTSKTSIEKANPINEKIAMTAPVMQEKDLDAWKIRFVMPKKYDLDTLPNPNSEKITLVSWPSKRFAVIRFSGIPDEKNLEKHSKILESYISKHRFTALKNVVYAFYNPPWTLPFLRRNEVMIEIESNK